MFGNETLDGRNRGDGFRVFSIKNQLRINTKTHAGRPNRIVVVGRLIRQVMTEHHRPYRPIFFFLSVRFHYSGDRKSKRTDREIKLIAKRSPASPS